MGIKKLIRQKYFVSRELQLSIALLVTLALLGGILLQSVAASLTAYFDIQSPILGIVMVVGYILIVAFSSIVFSNRLIGPFKRLEYEMKHIRSGELDYRLSLRYKDDLHVRGFVDEVNSFIDEFEELQISGSALNGELIIGLSKIMERLSSDNISKGTAEYDAMIEDIKHLQTKLHRFRDK